MGCQRLQIVIEGIVQGVGFRPFIYQLAIRHEVVGSVCNDTRGVTIEAEGEAAALQQFIDGISKGKPPLASIQSIIVSQLEPVGDETFTIVESARDRDRRAQIPPDTYVCKDCLQELFDPADRRYRYPFINCTNCGPRFTIVKGIPYDRPLTTMSGFPQCPACLSEYENPASRRFHAQPNACADCGPRLQLLDNDRKVMDVPPLDGALDLLRRGKIVAIKGLGGYHLAVDAANEDAVLELRRRKQRDEKPFALMCRDLSAVREIASVGDDEVRLLEGVERPIVLMQKKAGHGLAESIAPGNRFFGVMLPYTPLHYLLMNEFKALVMTSANLSDEPIAYEDIDACQRLGEIADAFLCHDRDIHTRTDDSIARVMANRPLLIRRSRGYVPRGVALAGEVSPVLAVGAELKNTICLTRGDRAFLSQHIGDLKNLEVYNSFKEAIDHLKTILEVSPELVAHDMHPDYYSSRYALEECDLQSVSVQHHHAHLASCLAEHGLEEPAIGMIFDGIGYGDDGHVWGGEFLAGDQRAYQRLGHFRYQPMPGGDLATREPWRMAMSYMQTIYGEVPGEQAAFNGIAGSELKLVAQATAKNINAPLTSSCGRLFDAVAAILGLRQKVSFEGQAAMELEMVADPEQATAYPVTLSGEDNLVFDPSALIQAIIEDQKRGLGAAVIAGRFHYSLGEMIRVVCCELRDRTKLNTVVLSGGVFQNCLLTELAVKGLERSGFDVITHSLVPPNDGGLALGQAVVASSQH